MERYCSTGQSPQRAVAPMEEEEEFYCYVTVAYVCIPRRFLVINVCDQGKTLCSPCILLE